jgi:hypothetical protein
MSLPQWSNDSVLLVDTPSAFIVNLNDAKPLGGLLDDIARLRTEIGKPCIVLRSHSPAGPFFNYFEENERIPCREPEDYVRMTQGVCAHLRADLFLPFASQVVYRRSDSEWANGYRVGFDLLQAGWGIATRLCPPFSTVDLETLSLSAEPPAEWRGAFHDGQRALVAREEARNGEAALTDEDIAALKAVLARQRWLLAAVLRGLRHPGSRRRPERQSGLRELRRSVHRHVRPGNPARPGAGWTGQPVLDADGPCGLWLCGRHPLPAAVARLGLARGAPPPHRPAGLSRPFGFTNSAGFCGKLSGDCLLCDYQATPISEQDRCLEEGRIIRIRRYLVVRRMSAA